MFGFKKKNEEREQGAGLPDIHVVICQLKGGNFPVEILEFDAVQDKDEDYNMHILNNKLKFKEELDRKRHYIIDFLIYKLNFTDKTKEEKIEVIDKKIKNIEDQIKEKTKEGTKTKDMKTDSITDESNIIDLKNDLRHFKVLKYTVENEGDGSYEIINKNGKREVRFLSKDGIFYPYFYRSDRDKGSPLTMYPDISLSRKYYREIDDKITERYLKSQDTNFFAGIKGVVITIIIALLVIANVMWATNNYKARADIDQQLDVCRSKCVDSATDCAFYYGKLIQDKIIDSNITTIKEQPKDKKTSGSLVDLSKKITDN